MMRHIYKRNPQLVEEEHRRFAADMARGRPDLEQYFLQMATLGMDAMLDLKRYKRVARSLPRPHTFDALKQAIEADPQAEKDRKLAR